MKKSISKPLILLSVAAAVAIICLNAWLAIYSVQSLAGSQGWVDHTWNVVESLENVQVTLNDVQSAGRGYLLSGEGAYLANYRQSKNNLAARLADIQDLVADNSEEELRLSELRAKVARRLSLWDSAIALEKSRQNQAVPAPPPKNGVLEDWAASRNLVVQMQQVEQRLLADRTQNSRRDYRRSITTILFASLVDLILIILLLRRMVAQTRLRRTADEIAGRLQKLQSITEAALSEKPAAELTMELLLRLKTAMDADSLVLCGRLHETFRVEAATGVDLLPGTILSAADAQPLERALATGEPIMALGRTASDFPESTLRQKMNALLIAPLSGLQSAAGVLVAGRRRPVAFSEHDEDVLAVAASRIGLALDRAQAHEAELQARRAAEAKTEEIRLLNAELEERVRERTAELEATNRELEAFSYSVSHDLRAPLRTIDGFSSALEEECAEWMNPAAKDYLRRIRAGVQRMGRLIDSLLQLSRVTRTELIREAVDVSGLASEVAGDLTLQNPHRLIHFEIRPGLRCMGDPRLLQTAFENLLENAVKFTARETEARIEFGRSGNAYFVRDNGVGFDMKYAGKLFTAFNRLHGERDFKGSGIGLATVGRIIRRHRGKIWAESAVGQGATFWFTLEQTP